MVLVGPQASWHGTICTDRINVMEGFFWKLKGSMVELHGLHNSTKDMQL